MWGLLPFLESRSNFRTSFCFTTDSGSLTSCINTIACAVMDLIVPSSSLSFGRTTNVFPFGPFTIAT